MNHDERTGVGSSQNKTSKDRKKDNMASKNRNPYRENTSYHTIFENIRKNQVVTRKGLIEAGFPVADITVVLSPRAEGASTREGDPRGNLSARGHVYFMEKLNKKKGEAQKFRLRYRAETLEKRVRPLSKEVVAQKTKKVAKAKVVNVDPVVAETVDEVETVETVETPVAEVAEAVETVA